MQKNGVIHKLDSLFILLIFGVFAVVSLLLVAIGAGVYQRADEQIRINTEVRSSLSYIANKVRANDRADALSIKTLDGVTVLSMRQDTEAELTDYIYYYNGKICEQLTFGDTAFKADYGEAVVAAESFIMEKEGNLFTFTVKDSSGTSTSISLCSRSSSL